MRNTSTYCTQQKASPCGGGWRGLFFYHPDHLGSSSFITDVNGEAYQHYEYMPYGELFVEQKGGTDQYTPYLFNGKELDDKTGLYYYGARYLDPKTSIWLSVDPMAEKKPHNSSYAYCLNNPINMIDPDGRDEWELNEQGKVMKHTITKEHDAFFIVNKDGDRIDGKSKTFEYGTVKMSYEGTYDKYDVKGSKNGSKLFEFLADNTNVEWGNIQYHSNKSTVTTSHSKNTLTGNKEELVTKGQLSGDVKSVSHSHPAGTDYPSGLDNRKSDIGVARLVEERYGNVESYIYLPNRNRYINEIYIPYNSKSDVFDFRNHPFNVMFSIPEVTVIGHTAK